MEKPHISVLYVDDEPINLMLFEAMFNREYNVNTFESPVDGLEYIKNNKEIDVVVSDMKMPKLNGVQFIREAIKISPTSIYFILTGFDISKEIDEALNEDIIKEYFQKPFRKDELVKAINKHVSKQ